MAERTWIVNGRKVTLAQFRADIDARKAAAQPIADAWRAGDIAACEAAQKQMRKQFPSAC
jgi:hypothetical protein